MSTTTAAAPPKRMTVEEFRALPDDGHPRWLIDGVVYPLDTKPARRTRKQGAATARVAHLLESWSQGRAERGLAFTHDVGYRPDPGTETIIGLDIAYIPPGRRVDAEDGFLDDAVALMVEIPSPWTTTEETARRISVGLKAGAVVWVLDPDSRTIDIHRPGRPRQAFNEADELLGDPDLPGFRAPVARFFEG